MKAVQKHNQSEHEHPVRSGRHECPVRVPKVHPFPAHCSTRKEQLHDLQELSQSVCQVADSPTALFVFGYRLACDRSGYHWHPTALAAGHPLLVAGELAAGLGIGPAERAVEKFAICAFFAFCTFIKQKHYQAKALASKRSDEQK